MTTASLWKSARIEVLTPSTLVLENNSRTILNIKAERAELIDSIREVGVLVPPIVNETPDGSYVVRDGFSRTLAAQVVVAEPEDEGEAELEMPVIVTTSQDEAIWQRLRDQFVINEIREGYNSADKARILEQFTLFGFDEEQIARHLSLDGEQVTAGLAVQRSTRAKTLMAENPQLDLFQLAAVTEFEHDEQAVASLEDTLQAEPEQFDHEIARLRHKRAEQQAREQLVSELTEQGVEVIQRTYTPARSELRYLKLSKDNPIALKDNPQAHAECPGHAAYVETMWSTTEARAVYVCQNWKKYGHLDTMSSSSSAPKQSKTAYEKAELKRVKANNADWRAAEEVRRAKLAEIVQRKTPPKKTQQFLAAALIEGTYELGRAFDRRHSYACQLLGLSEPGWGAKQHPMQTKLRRASANDAVTLQLTMVLAAYEDRTSVRTWRGDDTQKAYFRFLRDSCGYTLSPVERLVLDPSEDIQRWPHLQEATGDTTVAGASLEEDDLPDSELDGDGANGGAPAVTEVDADEDASNLPGAADEAEQVESLPPSVA